MKFNFSKKNIKFILIFGVFIGIGVIAGLSVNIYKNYGSNSTGAIIQDGVISGYTASEIEEIMQRKADESTFSFEINSRPFFENGKSEGNIRIYNPPFNNYLIDVEIKLDSNLKKGEYEATATISAYDPESEQLLGVSVAKLIIAIEN